MDESRSPAEREAFVRERMAELAQRFVQRAVHDRQRMAVAVQLEELGEVASIAHRLAGTATTFGYHDLGRQAKRVEGLVNAGAAYDVLNWECGKLFDLIDQCAGLDR